MNSELGFAYFVLVIFGVLSWAWMCAWVSIVKLEHDSPFPAVAAFFSPLVIWALYTVATA